MQSSQDQVFITTLLESPYHIFAVVITLVYGYFLGLFHFKSHNNGYTYKILLLFLKFSAKLFVNVTFCHTSCRSQTLHVYLCIGGHFMNSYLINSSCC